MASFIHDDRGTMELPMRLVVYVILTAAIVAVAAIGLQYLKSPMTTNIMEKQLGEIKVSLNTMQYGGARNLIDPASPDGNMRTFKITIPEDIEYLAFGVDPDPDNDFNLTNSDEKQLTDRGNVIFYKPRTGGKVRVPLEDSIELREGLLRDGRWIVNMNKNSTHFGVVITGARKYEITFELVYDPISKRKYTLAHFTDELDAYINPYDPSILPNSVSVSVNPDSIPADGIKTADVMVRLKDRKGRDAPGDGINITLETTNGTLKETKLITVKGYNFTTIKSDLVGTAMIKASSPGLNSGSTHLTITQKPINLTFNQWITKGCWPLLGCEILSDHFTTNEELSYRIILTGFSDVTFIDFWGVEIDKSWPVAHIEIDGTEIGVETINSKVSIEKTFTKVTLPQGDHRLNVTMTNEAGVPGLGGNLFVKSVELKE